MLFLPARVDFFPPLKPLLVILPLSSLRPACVWPFWGLSFSDAFVLFKPFTFQLFPVLAVKNNHVLLFFFWKLLQFFLTLKTFGRKAGGREVVNFVLSGISVCFSGLSSGGIVANLKHTDLFLMPLFPPAMPRCWKISPYRNTALFSTFWSWLWDTGTLQRKEWEDCFLVKPRWSGNKGEER